MDKIPISVDKATAGVRVAQVIGLTASAYLAGSTAGVSFFASPALLDSPAPLLAKQWKKIYDTGKTVVPPFSIVASAIFGALAYRSPKDSAAVTLYSIAAILTPSMVPFTMLVMGDNVNKLNTKASSMANASLTDAAAEAGVAKEETVHALYDKWSTLNLIRSLLPLTATVLAAWASVDKYDVLGLSDITFKSGANRMG